MVPSSHPVDVLMDVQDPGKRSLAHLELGRRALHSERRELAIRHFREAVRFDPKAPAPQKALNALGVSTRTPRARRSIRSWLTRRA